MQISNNYTSPNFGSFRINSRIQDRLHVLSPEDLSLVKKAQIELKDITSSTLELTDNFEPKIYSQGRDAFVKLFHPVKPRSNELNITTIWDGSPLANFRRKGQKFCLRFPFETKDAAIEAYKKVKAAKTPLGQAIETVKLLDNCQMANIIRKD